MNFAKFLEDHSIAACGHKAKENGYLLKIFTSCRPEETAKDFCFSTSCSGVEIRSDKCLGFPTSNELSPTQTAFGKDFTKLLCFQNIDQKCKVGELTHKWNWVDYVTNQRTSTVFDYVYLVRGTENGKDAWYYVLINSGCKEQFKIALDDDKIDLEKHGIVVYSGWGKKPPENIEAKVQAFAHD